MPTTSFRSPTSAREMPWDGGSGDMVDAANVLSGGVATATLPDGSSYTPTGTETTAGTVLSQGLLQTGYGFSSELPANSTVKGITIKTTIYSENAEAQDNYFFYHFAHYPGSVPFLDATNYFWFQPKTIAAIQGDTALKTIGGATDVWQPNPALYKDGMYIYSTDGSFPGYEVMTSTLDPELYDFFYNGHDLLIQPTTQGYANSLMDAGGSFATFNNTLFLAGGGTVTVSFPGSPFPPTTFVAQFGPVTPGDATFRCFFDTDVSLQSLSDQINFHADTSSYVSSSIFTGAELWNMSSTDVGAYTNAIHIQSNLPQYFDFPNGGDFAGGTDLDPNISTMNSITAAPLVPTAGGPIKAYADGAASQRLQITNVISHTALITSIPASFFRNPDFGIAEWFNPLATTGDALLYPEIPDNVQKLGKTTIALTYTLNSGGAANRYLLGVG